MDGRFQTGRWLLQEVRLVATRGLQVWRLVPVRQKSALGAAAVLMAVTSSANTAIPLLLGRLVAALQSIELGVGRGHAPDVLFRTAMFYLAVISAVYLGREVLNVVRRYLVENTCTRVDRDMTVRVIKHLLRVDLAQFTHEKVGALHGRLSRSVDGFVRFLRLFFLDFFPSILTGVFALVATVSKEPWLGLAMVGVIPFSVSLTAWQLISQKNVRMKLLRKREEQDGTVVEQLGGLEYVRAANTVEREVRRVARTAEDRRMGELRHHFEMSLFGAAKALNEGLFHVLVLALAIYLAIHGTTQFSDILTFSMLFLNVMTPLTEVHRVIDEGHEASLRVGDLLDILHSPDDPSFKTPPARHPDVARARPLIAVEDLRVEYVTADGRTRRALDGLNLTIRRGERVGIAGRSGGGKSTLLKVLLRLTHPSGGRVFFGGLPLDQVSREAIAELVGYVGQVPFVFAGTIEENIAYGVENATFEDVRRAAEKACIHDEIMAMPGGYKAPVAERGQNLSGGQRQRLALARLFLKNPPVLILDEATSALDTISERCVQRALAETRRDRTVIVVAHRLSTLLDADRILVFDNGRIVESGTYNDLVQAGGVFTELLMCAETAGSAGPSPGTDGPGQEAAHPAVASAGVQRAVDFSVPAAAAIV
jgi:ATP-binding cassette subfamily B protein